MTRRVWHLATLLAALHLGWWATQEVSLTSDSAGYLADGEAILERGAPTYFPPGYPVMVVSAHRVAGTHGALAITFIQHLMSVLAACMVFSVLRRVTSDRLAAAGAFVGGVVPTAFMMPQMVMSEAVTSFCLVSALYLALRARDQASLPVAIAAGMVIGVATITRVVPIVALAPAIAWILHDRGGARNAVRPLAALGAMAAVVALPLVLFARAGSIGLTTSDGFHLFNRMVTEERHVDTTATATRRLLALTRTDPRGREWWVVRESPGLDTMSFASAEELMGDVALEAIADAPLAWALGTPVLAARELFGDATGWMYEPGVHTDPNWNLGPAIGGDGGGVAAAAASAHGATWPLFAALAVVGALAAAWRRTASPAGVITWIPMGYLLASAAVEYYAPRHNAPITPFVVALAVLALDPRTWARPAARPS